MGAAFARTTERKRPGATAIVIPANAGIHFRTAHPCSRCAGTGVGRACWPPPQPSPASGGGGCIRTRPSSALSPFPRLRERLGRGRVTAFAWTTQHGHPERPPSSFQRTLESISAWRIRVCDVPVREWGARVGPALPRKRRRGCIRTRPSSARSAPSPLAGKVGAGPGHSVRLDDGTGTSRTPAIVIPAKAGIRFHVADPCLRCSVREWGAPVGPHPSPPPQAEEGAVSVHGHHPRSAPSPARGGRLGWGPDLNVRWNDGEGTTPPLSSFQRKRNGAARPPGTPEATPFRAAPTPSSR